MNVRDMEQHSSRDPAFGAPAFETKDRSRRPASKLGVPGRAARCAALYVMAFACFAQDARVMDVGLRSQDPPITSPQQGSQPPPGQASSEAATPGLKPGSLKPESLEAESLPRSDQAAMQADAPTLDTIHVTAPRPDINQLYRSKPVSRTAPTRFDRNFREPINLQKIGDQGGVVPILVNYVARKVTQGARKIPGWKGPDQPATARPPPLDDAQVERAMRLQGDASGRDSP